MSPRLTNVFVVPIAAALLAGASAIGGAQSARPGVSARVTLQLDSSVARFDARAFDLGVASNVGERSGVGPNADIRITKEAGPFTAELVQLSASGAHAASAAIEVIDSLGTPTMTIRLTDVMVMSDHVTLTTARDALEQQSISQQETLTQLSTEYQQAQRDLATAEELGKSRGVTRQEVTAAREHAGALQQRLALARQRQGLLARQLRLQSALDESVVLRFGRIEMDSPADGSHGAWDFSQRPSGDGPARKSPVGGVPRSLRP